MHYRESIQPEKSTATYPSHAERPGKLKREPFSQRVAFQAFSFEIAPNNNSNVVVSFQGEDEEEDMRYIPSRGIRLSQEENLEQAVLP